MAFEPHPWFIGLEGVEHSAEVARTMAWVATSGASGIVKPTDLLVRAQSVPADSVRIAPGGFVVESRYAGAAQQSYIERVPTETSLEVPATGSSGGATRYVVAQIMDPDYPGGGTVPVVPNDGVYARPYLVSSLSASRTEVVLAKIVQPANTAAITNAMITDLREVANPRRKLLSYARPRVLGDDSGREEFLKYSNGSGGEYFPGGLGSPNSFSVDVPLYASRAIFDAAWMGVYYKANTNPYGYFWIEYGDEYSDTKWGAGRQYEFMTQKFAFDAPYATAMRDNWLLADNRAIPAKLRGKSINCVFKAGLRNSPLDATAVKMDEMGGLKLKLEFVEAPDAEFGDAV